LLPLEAEGATLVRVAGIIQRHYTNQHPLMCTSLPVQPAASGPCVKTNIRIVTRCLKPDDTPTCYHKLFKFPSVPCSSSLCTRTQFPFVFIFDYGKCVLNVLVFSTCLLLFCNCFFIHCCPDIDY